MITWLTRMSVFDTLADLEVEHLPGLRNTVWQVLASMVQLEDSVSENHPTYRMWDGHHVALAAYGAACDVAMGANGIGVSGVLGGNFSGLVRELRQADDEPLVMPPWLEDTDVMRSHRSNLIRRYPAYTGRWPNTPESMPYLFPFLDGEGGYTLNVSKLEKSMLASGERQLPKSIQKKVANL